MTYLLHNQKSERLSFRKVSATDYEEWLPFFQDPRSHQYWTATLEPPEIECRKWYAKQFYRYENGLGGMNALIEKKSGALVGHCGLLIQTVDGKEELEIAYSLVPQYWNCGYASEAAKTCRDYAFKQRFAPSVISIISLSNTPSAKVARKNGMRIEKTTMYHENRVNIFRLTEEEWKSR